MAITISIGSQAYDGGPNRDVHLEHGGTTGDKAVRVVETQHHGTNRNCVTTRIYRLSSESGVGPVTVETRSGGHAAPKTYGGSESCPPLRDVGAGLLGALLGFYFGFLAGGFIAMPLFAILLTVLGEATYIPGQTTPWSDYRFPIQLITPAIVWGVCALGGTIWGFIDFYRNGA